MREIQEILKEVVPLDTVIFVKILTINLRRLIKQKRIRQLKGQLELKWVSIVKLVKGVWIIHKIDQGFFLLKGCQLQP